MSLPVEPATWRAWRRRLTVAICLTVAGVAALAIGLLRTFDQVIALGVAATLTGTTLRMWWTRRWWVGLRYRPDLGVIVVTRCAPAFEKEARSLFTASTLGPGFNR